MHIDQTVQDVARQMLDELKIDLTLRKIDKLPSSDELKGAIAFAFVRGAPENVRLPSHVRIAARLLKARRWAIPITIHSGNRDIYRLYQDYARRHGLDTPGA